MNIIKGKGESHGLCINNGSDVKTDKMCSQYVVHGDILNHVREVQGLYYISIERPSIGTLINRTGQKESDLAKPEV